MALAGDFNCVSCTPVSPAGRKGPGTPTNTRPFPRMSRKDPASRQPQELRPARVKLPTRPGTTGPRDSTSRARARPGRGLAPAVSCLLTPRGGLFMLGLGWRWNILQPVSNSAMQDRCWRACACACVCGLPTYARVQGTGSQVAGWVQGVCVYLEALVWGVGRLGTSLGTTVNGVNVHGSSAWGGREWRRGTGGLHAPWRPQSALAGGGGEGSQNLHESHPWVGKRPAGNCQSPFLFPE